MKLEALLSPKLFADALRQKTALVIGCLMFVTGAIQAQVVAELADAGPTNPVAGPLDISQFSTVGNGTFPDGLIYYTSDEISYGIGEAGQTFETGTNAAGYTVTSLFVKSGGIGDNADIGTPQNYVLHLYAVNGTNAVTLASYVSEPLAFTDGDWLEWSGISVSMSANSTYAYSFGLGPVGTGYESIAVDSDNPYANGEIGLFPPAGGGITFGPTQEFDAVFDIVLTSGGLPGLSEFSLSPTSNVFVGTPVTFNAGATGTQPLFLQWQFNGGAGFANIPGANSNSISLIAEITNSGAYQIIVTNIYGATTSAPITLTVTRDITPPTIIQSQVLSTTNVELVFSKSLDVATATNVDNYVFVDGPSVTNATLATNGNTVVLSTGVLSYGSNYTLIINGILDLAIPPNSIASNTSITINASPFVSLDIGGPPVATAVTVTSPNSAVITSDGKAIGGEGDQFGFSYELETGNFDLALQIASMGDPSIWAQAGLMGRSSLAAGSPYAATLATPGINGEFFSFRAATNGVAATIGDFPVNYPNTWLRLSRAGDVFTSFASYDGTNWTQLGATTIPMPSQIYVGLALACGSTSAPVTAGFVNFGSTPAGAALAAQVNPHEPIGPSSRTTGIVISEIMWKPAPRTDTNNCEYLELYNSNPWFFDISGYQITCADMNYTVPAGTVMPGGGYLVVAASPASIQAVYGVTNVIGPYTGNLKHSETLELLDELGRLLLTIPYTDTFPWPVATGGTGHSIVLANPTYGEGDWRAWDISDIVGGSPGTMESYRPSPQRNVVIDEVLAHSENPAVPQYVKLYNHSVGSVDISGCILTDDTTVNQFVIPSRTSIPADGFLSFNASLGFTLNPTGDTIFLINSNRTRVLDAAQFEGQADGVSFGRWPDGANDFYPLQTMQPETNNSAIIIGNIAINELMYDPISGNDADQYIELYNQGTNAVDLSGWQFTSGVTFTFPPGASIGPNGYIVVAKNTAELFANYTNLNAANTFGNYTGKLSHDGDRVALSMPQSLNGTNTIYVVEDEVTYGTGGRWGEWSDGGGSSLELINPHSNHRLAANWADSDDTQKSQWVQIQATGVLDNGDNYDAGIDYAQIGLLDSGECLVDNIEVNYNGVNYVANGTFDGTSGLADWAIQGCMACSSLETGGYGGSAHSLHIRCSDKVWTGDNSCQVSLTANSLAAGQTVTLQYQARWLHGWPEPLLRLSGNWLEATALIPVPANLGTPGAPNSKYVTNAGPAVYNVTHTPSVPAANQPVVVTANVNDPDGIQSLTLYYRLDPATAYKSVAMNDTGTGGDAIAGDGIFSATIPGQAANQVVAFYIAATDSLAASTRFPALRTNDNVAAPECVVMFGDSNPGGSFTVVHLWITQTNLTRWGNLGDMSRDWNNDCTLVNNNRVIYNMGGRYTGSPYHQDYNNPAGILCSYEWKFKDDDKFLGATDYKKIHAPGALPGSDLSLQRSQLGFTFDRALGVPWLNKRYLVLYVNGNRRSTLIEDTQVPNNDVVKEDFPNDTGGFLFKMQPWFEFAPFLSGGAMGDNNNSWCNLMPYTTTGGALKKARYRWNYEMRRTPDSYSDYTNVFSLVDAANSSGTPNYVANLENMADMDSWMRVFAAGHAMGCWDMFGSQNAQNDYGYIGAQGTKYTIVEWELETCFGGENNTSWLPGQYLLTVNSEDSNMQNIYDNPTFLRMYWRAMQELINGPLTGANSTPLLTAKYNDFIQNGLSVENPTTQIEPWIAQAKSSIASQLAAVNASSFLVGTQVTESNNVGLITGTAPVNVESIYVNGAAYPLSWNTLTGWTVAVPLTNGVNSLSVVGIDHSGQPVTGDSNLLTVSYTKAISSPVGHVVVNEIMYSPEVPGGQYVELYNNSTSNAYDLSGWQLPEISYTFPAGSMLTPGGYLLLAGNRAAFTAAYGVTEAPFDTFNTALTPGQMLSIEQPVNGSNTVVSRVQYDSVLPWPTNANTPGVSLQLIDSTQDNWRAGNWGTGSETPPAVTPQWVEATATGTATTSLIYIYMQSAGDVYIDDIEVVAGNVAGVGANLLSDGGFESGFPGPWTVSPNLTESALSTTIKHSGNASLHVVSTAAGTTESSAIYQTMSPDLTIGNTYTISYWYLQSTNGGPLTVRLSGSGIVDTVNPAPPGEALTSVATPGYLNSVAATLPTFAPLWINEVEPVNVTGITNSAGQHAPWVELYNPTTNAVVLTNLWLSTNYSDLTGWEFPTGATITPGQFLVVFADGQTNLSTLKELHTSFALNGSSGSVALSRLYNGQPQVLDYVNYNNIQPDWSYGSDPDGQSFVRQDFYSPTPGAANTNSGAPPSSSIAYSIAGSIYTQTFDSLPDPGSTSVNSANPVTIDGVTYSLANPYDFAFPAMTNGGTGGLGLASLAGWYGSSALLSRFGATDGDQTTGGQISFGLPNDGNRALGLLATSTTGTTAFGAKIINNTGSALNYITVQATGELWRQSNLPKTLQCSYTIDPTAIAPMPSQATGYLPALNVIFPTDGGDSGGLAVDGTAAANQALLAVTNQAITNWPAGAALWLVWQMTDPTGKAQGLAIDNFSFSASVVPVASSTNGPVLSLQASPASPFVISWPASASGYQLYSTTNLEPPVNWTLVTSPVAETNGTFYLPILPTNAGQFFRLSGPQ